MKIFVLTLLVMLGTFLDPVQCSASGNKTPHNREVDYKSKTIKLWVHRSGYVTKATFPGSFDPCHEPGFPHRRNFLIRIAEEEGFQFVAYIDENKKLLGVRSTSEDTLLGPNPTDELWHIYYDGRRFRLRLNPLTFLEEGIYLTPRNLACHGIRPELAIVAGIEFNVFRNHDGLILAASLPPRRL